MILVMHACELEPICNDLFLRFAGAVAPPRGVASHHFHFTYVWIPFESMPIVSVSLFRFMVLISSYRFHRARSPGLPRWSTFIAINLTTVACSQEDLCISSSKCTAVELTAKRRERPSLTKKGRRRWDLKLDTQLLLALRFRYDHYIQGMMLVYFEYQFPACYILGTWYAIIKSEQNISIQLPRKSGS